MKTYKVHEIFYSLQGEGVRAGTPNIFVRFAGCNLACNKARHGFDCDTNFAGGIKMTAKEIWDEARQLGHGCMAVVFTGGEPALQVGEELLNWFIDWYCAIETNGTVNIDGLKRPPYGGEFPGLNWITCSPKPPDDDLAITKADELKYVIAAGMPIPDPIDICARLSIISPAYDKDGLLDADTLDWCIKLVRENPQWRLSVQQHKGWGIR